MESNKLRLHGFNNLTKTLSFNIYDVSYAVSREAQKEYIDYIDETYNAERLTQTLQSVAEIVGAEILNIARQDYEPQGASVTLLIAEGEGRADADDGESPGPLPDAVVGHLDKSHITVHTYPENHPDNGISTFRVDIDVSTCGHISPLRALHFIDHEINSIQNFIDPEVLALYQAVDVNVYPENIFHTKLRIRDFELEDYLFGVESRQLEPDLDEISGRVEREILEIFYGANLHR